MSYLLNKNRLFNFNFFYYNCIQHSVQKGHTAFSLTHFNFFTRIPAAGLSTSHVRGDWLHNLSSAAKWLDY